MLQPRDRHVAASNLLIAIAIQTMNYLPPFLLSTIAATTSWKEDIFIFIILDAIILIALPTIIPVFINKRSKPKIKNLKLHFINEKMLFVLMIGSGAAYLSLLHWSQVYWFLLHNYIIFFFALINSIIIIKSESN